MRPSQRRPEPRGGWARLVPQMDFFVGEWPNRSAPYAPKLLASGRDARRPKQATPDKASCCPRSALTLA